MDTNTFDIGRADTALTNARDAVGASKTAPVKPVTPVGPYARPGTNPAQAAQATASTPDASVARPAPGSLYNEATGNAALTRRGISTNDAPTSVANIMANDLAGQNADALNRFYRPVAPLVDPIRNWGGDAVARTVGAVPAIAGRMVLDAGKEMISRGVGFVSPNAEQSIRSFLTPAPVPIDASTVAAPAPAVAADPRGYIEVNGKREYMDGTKSLQDGPGSLRQASPEEMEQFRRAAGGATATPDAPAAASSVARPGAQVPDIRLPEFTENENSYHFDPSYSRDPAIQKAYVEQNMARLNAFHERKNAYQKASLAAELARAGYTHEQAMEILRGGTQRDVATINDKGASARYAADAKVRAAEAAHNGVTTGEANNNADFVTELNGNINRLNKVIEDNAPTWWSKGDPAAVQKAQEELAPIIKRRSEILGINASVQTARPGAASSDAPVATDKQGRMVYKRDGKFVYADGTAYSKG